MIAEQQGLDNAITVPCVLLTKWEWAMSGGAAREGSGLSGDRVWEGPRGIEECRKRNELDVDAESKSRWAWRAPGRAEAIVRAQARSAEKRLARGRKVRGGGESPLFFGLILPWNRNGIVILFAAHHP